MVESLQPEMAMAETTNQKSKEKHHPPKRQIFRGSNFQCLGFE